MKLSALLLTLVIALGVTAPLEARSKHKAPKAPKARHAATYKAPKRKTKPTKAKPMKYRKPKHSANNHRVKPAKAGKTRTPKSV